MNLQTRYPVFDVEQLVLGSVEQRRSKVQLAELAVPVAELAPGASSDSPAACLAAAIVAARRSGNPVIIFMGAHMIKCGLSLYLRRLIEEGWVTLLASNGAAAIHDYELAGYGATSEYVAESIVDGSFGMWREHRRLNQWVELADFNGRGLGETIGSMLLSDAPHREVSVLACAYEHSVPFTVHVLIGGDITHMHAGSGDSYGSASYVDFLIFAEHMRVMQERGGVFVNIGSAVQGPEIYLKAVSMARNVLHHEGKPPASVTTGVMDMYNLPVNWAAGEPTEDRPEYYFRPWKTILLRSLGGGARSYYIQGNYRHTLPVLYQWLCKLKDTETHD